MADAGPLEKNDQPQREKLLYEALLGLKGMPEKKKKRDKKKKKDIQEPLIDPEL